MWVSFVLFFGGFAAEASRMRWKLEDVCRIRDQWVRVVEGNATVSAAEKAERLRPLPPEECEARLLAAWGAGVFDEEDVSLWRQVGLTPILIERAGLTFFAGIHALCAPPAN